VSENDQPTVAVLGCGLMGSAVVRALGRQDVPVVAWNRSPEKATALVGGAVSAVQSVQEALASAEVVISVLQDFDVLQQALGERPDLLGRVLVNLSTGSPEQASDMQRRVHSWGGAYLDGVIGAFPEEIGQEGCVINYAGDPTVFDRVEPTLRVLGSGLRFVGDDVGVPAALDAAVVGMFFIPALVAFGEAVGGLRRRGVDLGLLNDGLQRTVGILGHQMNALLVSVQADDHATDQATVDTYAHAAEGFLEDVRGDGARARLLAAAVDVMHDVQAAGWGGRGMSAVAAVHEGGSA
jgi:3-hydroxyisobutyrate dehydrogenase-like beta-hydroxyacid dehydrogenase